MSRTNGGVSTLSQVYYLRCLDMKVYSQLGFLLNIFRCWRPLWGVEFICWQILESLVLFPKNMYLYKHFFVLEKDSNFEQWPSPVFDVGSCNFRKYLPGTPKEPIFLNGCKWWFPSISYVKNWFIIQLKQPLNKWKFEIWGSRYMFLTLFHHLGVLEPKIAGGLQNKLCECTPHVFVDDCFQHLGERDVKTLTVIGAIRLHVAVGGVKFLEKLALFGWSSCVYQLQFQFQSNSNMFPFLEFLNLPWKNKRISETPEFCWSNFGFLLEV